MYIIIFPPGGGGTGGPTHAPGDSDHSGLEEDRDRLHEDVPAAPL